MQYTITLPVAFQPCDIRTLLEEKWLVPRKVRHFLRTRKNVWINGEPKMFHEMVFPGDSVTLKIEESDYPTPTVLLGDKGLVKPIYEDEHLIVVEKPIHMKTHPNQPNEQDTMLNHVAAYLKEEKQTPYVVHRLDKETSGLLMFAKNPFILPILGRLLEQKKISRHYQAIVTGKINQKSLTITKKIGRDRHDKRKRVVDEHRGQFAQTFVEVINNKTNQSNIICRLATGRTHQIRVHLTSIGHPIIGDPLYNTQSKASRLMLHAFELEFIHPLTQDNILCHSQNNLW